jgi:hypothetical protein
VLRAGVVKYVLNSFPENATAKLSELPFIKTKKQILHKSLLRSPGKSRILLAKRRVVAIENAPNFQESLKPYIVNKSSVVLTLILAQKQCFDKFHFNT